MQRRDLIKGAVATIPAATALTMLNTKWAFAQSDDFSGPLDVLNYALTLEYLEAEFYRQGNASGLLSGTEADYLRQIGEDEATHVAALTDTINQLGGTPVAAPGVDFGESFADRASYLETAYVFENTGVGAYLGAAPALFDQKELLAAAAGIFGVEARHAAVIANLTNKPAEGGVYFNGAFEKPTPRSEVLAAVAPFLTGAAGMASGAAAPHRHPGATPLGPGARRTGTRRWGRRAAAQAARAPTRRFRPQPDLARRDPVQGGPASASSHAERLAPLQRADPSARVDARRGAADVWFEPGLVLEVLGAELTPSPNHTAGLALRFPRFTGRYRDDKAPEDATTVRELADLHGGARTPS